MAKTLDNGSVVQTSPFFPNKQYGLNGRHLRIGTMPVNTTNGTTLIVQLPSQDFRGDLASEGPQAGFD